MYNCYMSTKKGGKGDHKGCTFVGMCLWNGLLKSTEVRSYSPKAENVNILFKKHFHASNLWRSQGHWLMLRTEKTLCYLGLIFKQCIIVMAECRVWGAGGTEKGMCPFVGVNMCVFMCVYADYGGLHKYTSQPSQGLLPPRSFSLTKTCLTYSESQVVPCVCEINSHMRRSGLALSSVHHFTRSLVLSFVNFLLSSHGRQLISGHMTDVYSPCQNDFKKERHVLCLNYWSSENCLSQAMVVEGIHYHQRNLWVLSYKGIKDTGLGITRS